MPSGETLIKVRFRRILVIGEALKKTVRSWMDVGTSLILKMG